MSALDSFLVWASAEQLGLSVKATSFPQALNMGCTWNRTAMRGVGRTIGRELRALSNVGMVQGITAWSPTINLIRDPRWGRCAAIATVAICLQAIPRHSSCCCGSI